MTCDSRTIEDSLLEVLLPRLGDRTVQDISVGLIYSAARLNDGAMGVGHHPGRGEGPCRPLRGAGTLAGRPAQEIGQRLSSKDPVEAAVGLATLNAAAPGVTRDRLDGDIRELLQIEPGERVAMVGYFAPLVPWLRRTGAQLDIVELRHLENTRPAEDAEELLPRCDIALLTATALINHTLGHLLALAGSAREVVLLGPSTPMAPELFVDTPVTMLAGVEVADGDALMRVVREGGSTRQFGATVRKVCVRLR